MARLTDEQLLHRMTSALEDQFKAVREFQNAQHRFTGWYRILQQRVQDTNNNQGE